MSKKIYFTPGPSELYFTVEGHIRSALREGVGSISHRGQQFKDIYKNTVAHLRSLMDIPDDYHILFTNSATEVWEHSLRNCVEKHTCHLVNGAFSKRFWDFSGKLGLNNQSFNSSDGDCADPKEVTIDSQVELLGITLNESSTGVAYPMTYLQQIREANPDVLITVDGVSSLPVPALDFELVDMVYFSVQKCFGLPAGLGVWVVGPKALARANELGETGRTNTTYRSLPEMVSKGVQYQTIETPNILNIYLLGKVAEDMLRKGLDMIRRESKYKAAVIYQLIENVDWLSHFVKNPEVRSETVIAADCVPESSDIIRFAGEHGFVIGGGYGQYKAKQIRIANFPTHSKELVERLSDVLAQYGG